MLAGIPVFDALMLNRIPSHTEPRYETYRLLEDWQTSLPDLVDLLSLPAGYPRGD